MWRNRYIGLRGKGFNGVTGGLQRGATRTEGYGKVFRFERRELLPGRLKDELLFRRPWRKELE